MADVGPEFHCGPARFRSYLGLFQVYFELIKGSFLFSVWVLFGVGLRLRVDLTDLSG